jgi:hypothetical protein
MSQSGLSWEEEALKRIPKVQQLQTECMKYVVQGDDSLAQQILAALLKTSSRKNGPVKLAEITEEMYGPAQKDKLDVVRLMTEKTLLRCGIVEKIYFSERDVRYFPTAYRFQEVRKMETGTGKTVQLVGDPVALPKDFWPIPAEYFELTIAKETADEALSKLQQDKAGGVVDDRAFERISRSLADEREGIERKLKRYAEVAGLM